MDVNNDWLLENLSGSHSLGMIDDSVDSLIGEFDSLMNKIRNDKKNYMLEAISTMKDKIITSKVKNVLELIDSTKFTDGEDFRTLSNVLSITANKYTDNSSDSSGWTISNIESEMDGKFEKIEKIEKAVVQKGYSNAYNTVSVKELASATYAIPKSADTISVPFAEIDSSVLSDTSSVINVEKFLERYIPSSLEKEIDLVKLSIDTALKNIKISISDVSFINQSITDTELMGSGSKISDYKETTEAKNASDYVDVIQVVLNYVNDYVINVGGTDYKYTADADDTAEDIASGLTDSLGDDDDIDVSASSGYHSIVFKNGNGDKVFGWYAEDEDDSVTYAVKMIVPSDKHDLTIEQDTDNDCKINITFEHDGSDVVYPSIGDVRDLVNSFEDVPIRVVVMPGFDVTDDYDTADDITLDHGDSKITIDATSQQSVSVTLDDPYKMLYTHISDFSEAVSQIGYFEVIKFNPTNTYYVDIDGTKANVDPTKDENKDVIDEPTLAKKFLSIINNGKYSATAVVNGNTITLIGKTSGDSFPVSTSGANNYIVPIKRNSLLKYDLMNIPNIGNSTVMQLTKETGTITNENEPLNISEIETLINSGVVYSENAMMCPQVPKIVDTANNFVPNIKSAAQKLESLIHKESFKIQTSDNLVSPVIRSMPKLIFPLYSTDQSKSNRWFFIEAGENSISAKSAVGVALSTISPSDYERLVFQDTNKTFSSAREKRLPNVGQNYESIDALITKKVPSYNSFGGNAVIKIPSEIITSNVISLIGDYMTDVQIDGFIKYALLPPIVNGNSFIDIDKYMGDASDILKNAKYSIISSSSTDSYKMKFFVKEKDLKYYDVKELFKDTEIELISVEDHSVTKTTHEGTSTQPVSYSPERGFTGGVIKKQTTSGTMITLGNKLVSKFIVAKNPIGLYLSLMELAIQIDDALREQRFIALAGSYVIDASKLVGLYSDSLFADYVFGVNEDEKPPTDNYGIGGIPIDATVTMSKLYFRNMRSQALSKSDKSFALGNELTVSDFILYLVSKTVVSEIKPDDGYTWHITTNDDSTVVLDKYINTSSSIKIPINGNTGVEDRVYKEISRTGYFSTNIDLGINHTKTGISSEFKDSIWSLLTDAFEIADDGTIVSINSAKTYIQELYQSFNSLTENQFSMMLLDRSVYFNSEESSIYSPLVTIYLKIILYLIEKKGSIAYDKWKDNFNSVVGLIFMDDELATDILSYDMFLVWVGAIGAHNSFSWKDDIKTDIQKLYATIDIDIVPKKVISKIEYNKNGYTDNKNVVGKKGILPDNKVKYGILSSEIDECIIPSISIDTANTVPVANAGDDISQSGAGTVVLDGSKSADSDGDKITYLWEIKSSPSGSSPSISGETTSSPSLVVDSNGDYIIGLVVSDTFSSSPEDTVKVTVS